MRAFNQQMGSTQMALATESVDFVASFRQMMSRLRRKTRSAVCTVINGGHELYRARTDTKLYQECLLCGHETQGWEIARRDHQLHLVGNRSQAIAAARR